MNYVNCWSYISVNCRFIGYEEFIVIESLVMEIMVKKKIFKFKVVISFMFFGFKKVSVVDMSMDLMKILELLNRAAYLR